MPHIFGKSSVNFLERYQFIPSHKDNNSSIDGITIPTDSLSLLDVVLHVNSIFKLFSSLKKLYTNESVDNSFNIASQHLQEDMIDFDNRLSEELLAPLLLSFLSFYIDESISIKSIRQTLRAFFETTPYISELNDKIGTEESSLYSNIAVLLINLMKAILLCHFKLFKLQILVNKNNSQPLLPWLFSRAEYVTRTPTWYWEIVQDSTTIKNLLDKVFIYRNNNKNKRGKDNVEDEDAITLSKSVTQPVSRKRSRYIINLEIIPDSDISKSSQNFNSYGIIPLPYDVQGIILEYLSPRSLSTALLVCRVWWSLIYRSSRMRFYLYTSRIITKVFIKFLDDDWGQAWIRVNDFTTLFRLSLKHKELYYIESHLQQRRELFTYISCFIADIYKQLGPGSNEWEMLRLLWNAIEVEFKLLPFLGLHNGIFPSLLYHGESSSFCDRLSEYADEIQLKHFSILMRRANHFFPPILAELIRRRSLISCPTNFVS